MPNTTKSNSSPRCATETPATQSAPALHTPGPWRAVQTRNAPLVFAGDLPSDDQTIVNGEEMLVASAYGMANAHLIAAAPELLEALRLCEQALTPARNGEESEAANAARAAIARATAGTGGTAR